MLSIERSDPAAPDAVALLDALSEALAAISGDSGRASFDADDVRGARACFVVARGHGGRALGCGALRPLQDDIAEIKRMYAAPGSAGVGSALLDWLEAEAASLGYGAVWLETRLVNARALRFYQSRGYARIANYGKYAGRADAVCLGKRLG
ncbi:MAG: GNAT family N-acetyltransferase [Pseudomonadota bacterium]